MLSTVRGVFTSGQAKRLKPLDADSRSVFWALHTGGILLILVAWLLPWFIEPVPRGVTKKPGYGYSAQDAFTNFITFSWTGVGSFIVFLLFLCVAALIAFFLYDVTAVWLKDVKARDVDWQRVGLNCLAFAAAIILPAIFFGGNLVSVGAAVGLLAYAGTFARDGLVSLLGGRDLTPFRFMRARGYIALAGVGLTLLIWALVGVYRAEDLFGSLSNAALTGNAVWMMVTGMAVVAFAFLREDRMTLLILSGTIAIISVSGAFVPWMHSNALFSAQYKYGNLLDAISGGEATVIAAVIVLAAIVAAAAGFVADCVASVRANSVVIVYPRLRGYVGLAGAAAAVVLIWITVGARTNAFGNNANFIDSRAGVAIAGVSAMALLGFLSERIVANRLVGLGVVALSIGGLFPLIFNQSVDFIAWGAGTAAIYTLLALGLNVVVGYAGLLDLGYAAFFAIGAYTAGSLNSPKHGLHLSFFLIMWVALAMAALFGAILGAPTLRLRGDYLAIVTLGFGEIVPDMATNNLFNQTGGPNGITGIGKPSIFGYSFGLDNRPFFWTLLIIIVLVMLAFRNLERSRLGRAWMAIREDEIAANATGINTVSTKLLAFAIGASVSGFAGAFFGAQLGLVTNEDFSFAVSVTVLSTVVLGGIGSIAGAALGGVLISFIIFWVLPLLQEWITTFGDTYHISAISSTASNPIDYSQYKYIVYGLILIGIMLLRPGGLLPSRARKIELEVGEEVTPLAAVREVA